MTQIACIHNYNILIFDTVREAVICFSEAILPSLLLSVFLELKIHTYASLSRTKGIGYNENSLKSRL